METGGIRIPGLQEFRFGLGFRIWGLGAEGLLWGVQIRSSGRTKALNRKS